MLVVCGILLSGCTITNRLFRDREAEERAAAILQVQIAVMRFADEYAARINERIGAFQQANADPEARLASQAWLVSQATGAFTIASGPNPELNAWGYASVLLSEAQINELRDSIQAWHRENPLLRAVPFIHLEDFAFATSATRRGSNSSSSIFSFLGIDPLSNLDPAVRELAQSRQLAERAVYYGQRAPKLISMEAQRLAFEMAVTPESVRMLDSFERIGGAAQTTSELAADLPQLLAEEREAVIEQLTGILDERQGQLQALVVELRSTLEAGGTTSDSVRETIAALDALMARFERRPTPAAGAPSRPFDVTEYTEALRQMGDTAQQLQSLLVQADSQAPGLTALSDRAAGGAAALVDQMYWRLVQLALVLVVASVIGALVYRAIARRW